MVVVDYRIFKLAVPSEINVTHHASHSEVPDGVSCFPSLSFPSLHTMLPHAAEAKGSNIDLTTSSPCAKLSRTSFADRIKLNSFRVTFSILASSKRCHLSASQPHLRLPFPCKLCFSYPGLCPSCSLHLKYSSWWTCTHPSRSSINITSSVKSSSTMSQQNSSVFTASVDGEALPH